MAYNINKANGNLLTTIQDGTLNSSASPFKLPGRNYSGYGEAIAENFIQHLENFANSSPPNNPLPGQLWFDTSLSSGKIKFRDKNNSSWIPVGGSVSQSSPPSSPSEGDLFWDDNANVLYGYDSDNNQWLQVGIQGGNSTVTGRTRTTYLRINSGGSGGSNSNGYSSAPSGGTETDAFGIVVAGTLVGIWSDSAVGSPTYYYDPNDFNGSDIYYYAFTPANGQIVSGLNVLSTINQTIDPYLLLQRGAQNGEVLTWDSGNSRYEPQPITVSSQRGDYQGIVANPSLVKSSSFTAVAGSVYECDTSGSSFTVTLPGSPQQGDIVEFEDHASSWGTNSLTVSGNGANILGSSNFTADVDNWPFALRFNGTQWIFAYRP